MMKRGKKYSAIAEKIEKNKLYEVEEALGLVKEGKVAKFDESVEVHVNLGIDNKKDQVRGSVVLPHGTGKVKKVAVITSTKTKEAEEAGADLVGAEELIEKIKNGKAGNFDVVVATPEMMPKLAQVAKILGPKGLMPSPKTETVTDKIKEAVESLKKGKASFKNDNTGNVHQVIGKLTFDVAKLKENLEATIDAVEKARPAGVKGAYIKSISVCSTMGPAVKISRK
ncbi:MAG TPA: 50S ribosomal protein L1 [Candidatus Moranbacteria bacterium]|nr:50S ribosomal protein L1 [Candidatus Moranbacteria bacterium]